MAAPPWFNPDEFREDARRALDSAARLARDNGARAVGARHVACALFCEHPVGARIAAKVGANQVALAAALLDRLRDAQGVADDEQLFLRCARAQRPSYGPKGTEDVVLALFEPPFGLAPVFAEHGLTLEALRGVFPDMAGNAAPVWGHGLEARGRRAEPAPPEPAEAAPRTQAAPAELKPRTQAAGLAASQSFRAAPAERAPPRRGDARRVLSTVGTDLVERARQGRLDPVIGRDAEVARVMQVLARRTKNNVCLVGAPGVGKTAVAEAVAQRIADGRVPRQLRGCRELWALDIGALLAGTGLRGDFEERLRDVLAELREAGGAALLFIDELHLVLGAGRSENNNVDAANLLKPMLARGELRCIGATTTEEYDTLIRRKDAAFERRFQPLALREPSPAQAVEMLRGLRRAYEEHHNVRIGAAALEAAVQLSHARIRGRQLPDKAIDVMDEACCLAGAEGATEATVDHVEAVVQRWGSFPPASGGHPRGVEGALRWLSKGLTSLRSRL